MADSSDAVRFEPIDFEAVLDDELLEVFNQLPPKALEIDNIDKVRAGFKALIDSMPKPAIPDGVTIEDRSVHHDGADVPVRIYRSEGAPESAPALLWIHGGGMVLGDLEGDNIKCSLYAVKHDAVIVAVDYRLAPEHPYPAPLDDCYAALCWMATNAAELGIDHTRIAIGGASAGGGLAAGLALRARDSGGPAICFQLLTYPMIDDRNQTISSHLVTNTRVWNRESNAAGWSAYLDGRAGSDDVEIYAAPARAVDLAGLPPARVTVGQFDLFLDENIDYAKAMLHAGVEVELVVYPGAFHGSNGMVPRAPVSRRWSREDDAALRRAWNLEPKPARMT